MHFIQSWPSYLKAYLIAVPFILHIAVAGSYQVPVSLVSLGPLSDATQLRAAAPLASSAFSLQKLQICALATAIEFAPDGSIWAEILLNSLLHVLLQNAYKQFVVQRGGVRASGWQQVWRNG